MTCQIARATLILHVHLPAHKPLRNVFKRDKGAHDRPIHCPSLYLGFGDRTMSESLPGSIGRKKQGEPSTRNCVNIR